jgi:lysozyme
VEQHIVKTSSFGIAMIEAFEGFFPKPYHCPAGVLTQGYGHTKAAGGEPIGGEWSRAKARDVLADDLARRYEPGVLKLLKRKPSQGQFDAMVSFAFNCGEGALAKSSILKHFNRGNDDQAAAAFGMWVKAGGKTLPGLVRRRGAEALAYRGIKDADFNGKRTSSDPIYGPMPQVVEATAEPVAKSGKMQGTITSGAAGAGVVLKNVQDALTTAEPHINAGTWIGIALGCVILAGAAYAGWRVWKDSRA